MRKNASRPKDELVRLRDELEQQVQTKTEALRQANQHLLLDLADRMKTEVALRDSESQLRAMFENALDAMILLDDDRRILDANESAQQLFGYGIQELLALRWDALIPAAQVAEIEAHWKSVFEEGTKRGEIEVRRACGSARLVSFSARANIQPGRHLITLRDLTEQREAEDSLRLLSQRLMRLQDEERRRIARELHDSTGQSLSALAMHLDVIMAGSHSLPPRAQKSAAEAVEICRNCSTDIRTISYLLHPPLLDEAGLASALRWYIDGFAQRSQIHVDLEFPEDFERLSRESETAIFRTIQECLTNIHRHSESTTATIRIAASDSHVCVEVGDRGKGIPPEKQFEMGSTGITGVGIRGMRERLRQLGGSLEIHSNGGGTLVVARLPATVASASTAVA